MAEELQLTLLGNPEIRRDGALVTDLRSRKAIALLCYLAVTGHPHLRPLLVGLLWGEMPEANAQNNLSKALTHLRQVVGHHLRITRQEVAFDRESSYWLDVEVFEQCASALADIEQLQSAVELYRGDFLEGFYVHQSPAFEEWVLTQRTRLRELALQALYTLATYHARRGPIGNALATEYTARLLALEPWREEAHRQMMLLLAASGQRSAALAQYEACCQMLAEELGVEPGMETTDLYKRIRDGKLGQDIELATAPVALPPFLSTTPPHHSPHPPFVARERELDQLDVYLETALAYQGQVSFITGEAGTGKTALAREFTQRAQEQHTDLLVAYGGCLAYTGVGDPYLPFREILGMLTGDVEVQWDSGTISSEQARRLWNLAPFVAQALVESNADLIDAFVSGSRLVARATAAAPRGARWLAQLEELVASRESRRHRTNVQQTDLFEQYTRVLSTLARRHPLLLVVDDLQWADAGSISLLFHLGRQLGSSRILVVGIYRPTEVASGREEIHSGKRERHPLEPVLNEFRRHFGQMAIDLKQTEDLLFVEALLDTEPNRLGNEFRRALHRRTKGHALFTVEMLRGMQERGDLVLDDAGRWVEGATLDWESLPVRVDGVIGERIGRLPTTLQEALKVASVEGESFTAEVVAQVRTTVELEIVGQLSGELDKRHRLVRSQGSQRLVSSGRRLSRYQFRHILIQKYLYGSLDKVERAYLHEAVGNALEELYQGQVEEIAPQLGRHFAKAGKLGKAIHYLLQAGDRARGLYAHREAIEHYQQALAFLQEQGDYERAARTLMKLGLTYHSVFDFQRSRQAYDEGFVLRQQAGQVLLAKTPPAPHPLRVLSGESGRTLDPAFTSISIFSGLVESTPEMDVVPDVARRWEVLEGGRKYVFHLRDDVRWSDGTPVTAGDFEYAWKRALDPATKSPMAGQLYDIKGAEAFHRGEVATPDSVGVRAIDETTLVVELEAPTGYFLHLLTSSVTCPVPRHTLEAHSEDWTAVGKIVTNGPFRLESWQQEDRLVLTRNEMYHGQFRGNVGKVELLTLGSIWNIEDWDARALALYEMNSTLDVMRIAEAVGQARQRHAEEHVSFPILWTIYLRFDVTRPPYNDLRVRRAFALAIDRARYQREVTKGLFAPATGGFLPPGMPGHSAGIGLPYDPARARRLLAEAGYPEGYHFPSVKGIGGTRQEADYLQTQWRENLRVEVEWEVLDVETAYETAGREQPPLFFGAWIPDYPDPDSFLRVCLQAPYFNWHDEAFDRLVEEARRLTDQEKRMKLYRQADCILAEQVPLTPLFYGRLHLLVKPWVRNYLVSPTRGVFWKDVVIDPH